ncbi:MAG: glycosyltransferase [Prevotella sp.]|nr:glycosyltransferase [Prevotella sp.]
MNKFLIILDHESRIPPFMIAILLYSKDQYKNVYYINTRKPSNEALFSAYHNIDIMHPSRRCRFWCSVLAFVKLFFPRNIKQLYNYVCREGFHVFFLKSLLLTLVVESILCVQASRIIKKQGDKYDLTVLATWFSAAAVASATLKRNYKSIKAVSLAHSYEILVSRNKNVPYLFVDYKHKYLDGVFFIAQKMRELYIEGIGGLAKEYLNKTHVFYLGTYKNSDVLNLTKENEFHICTCSRTIPLKRLDVLIKALSSWKESIIYWTHIGDGEIFDKLKSQSEELMRINPFVHIDFIGYLTNEQVKDYYANNSVDLFVNLSSIEGLPISIMEAISYGIPVMATDVGGTNEVVNSTLGYLLKSDISPQYVKDNIMMFLNLPVEQRSEMRNNAYNYWKSHFNAEDNLVTLFKYIDSLN